MATKNIAPLKDAPNAEFLDAIWYDSSSDYQSRIPEATKAGVQATQAALQTAGYRPQLNEFQDALVNRVGLQLIKNTSWTNPLKEFKIGQLTGGDTIEEIHTGMVLAKSYDADRDEMEKALFGTHRGEVRVNFHRIGRRDVYELTLNNTLLMNAFDSPQGLSAFTTKMMESVSLSDEYDEFLLMCQLFPQYAANGGYFDVQVADVANIESDAASAKDALRKLRFMADKLAFPSRRYNAAGMPVFARKEDLILLVTPEFNAAIDVEALAGAFNVDKANMHGRVVVIPEEQFGMDGVQAIMTTKDFFVVADQVFETASQYNPRMLQNNYFLHHHQVISASTFVPAIRFTTHKGDDVITVRTPVTSVSAITIKDRNDVTPSAVTRGEIYSLFAEAVTTPSGGVNDGVRYNVSGNTSVRTYVTRDGVLHVGPDEGADTFTVRATATWLDPKGLTKDGKFSELSLDVTGPALPFWPVAGSDGQTVTGISVEGVPVTPAFDPAVFAYTVIVPGGTTTAGEVQVDGPDAGEVDIALNTAGDVVTITANTAPGDPVYTVTVN
jgi:hypothetical protein